MPDPKKVERQQMYGDAQAPSTVFFSTCRDKGIRAKACHALPPLSLGANQRGQQERGT
jgi:hypothetical protein